MQGSYLRLNPNGIAIRNAKHQIKRTRKIGFMEQVRTKGLRATRPRSMEIKAVVVATNGTGNPENF